MFINPIYPNRKYNYNEKRTHPPILENMPPSEKMFVV